MKIYILPAAIEDLSDGRDFYASQGEEIGDYFMDCLKSDIDSLQIFAGIHAVHFGTHYRMLSKRFPFAIYYRMVGEVVYVDAILDCRQNPMSTHNRMRKK